MRILVIVVLVHNFSDGVVSKRRLRPTLHVQIVCLVFLTILLHLFRTGYVPHVLKQ
jgi:hypothetical protein